MAIGGMGAALLLVIATLIGSAFFYAAFSMPYYVMVVAVLAMAAAFTGVFSMFGVKGKPIKNVIGIIGVISFAFLFVSYGFLGFTLNNITGLFTGTSASLAAPALGQQVVELNQACQAGLTAEELDDAADVTLNAYDLAADAGFGTAVDLTTNCRFYNNGNSGENFVAASTDTSAKTESSYWGIGDTAFIYCGGTSYYTTPVEGHCIDAKVEPIVIESYGIINAASDISISVYDENKNALTAAGNSTTADFDLTLSANQKEPVIVELNLKSGTEAYNVGTIATGAFNDIDGVYPENEAGMQAVVPVDFLKGVSVSDDDVAGATNHTVTFDVWNLNQPKLLLNWDDYEVTMVVDAGSTDPSATDNVWSTLDGGIVCFLDATYSRGSDGIEHLDYHDHATDGESDVGYTNTYFKPVGGSDCVVIEGN